MRCRFLLVLLSLVLGGCVEVAPAPVSQQGELRSTATVEADCALAQALCGTRCIDLESDPHHCGACGYACAQDARCLRGRCRDDLGPPEAIDQTLPLQTTRCRADHTACGDECVDVATDRLNCGGCGVTCVGSCARGACQGGV